MTSEIYISTDVETDGPIPGEYSMLSLGSVAIDKNGKILGEFYKKLKPLPKAKQHPETMRFWKQNLEAWKEATSDPEDPEVVIKEYIKWCFKFRSDSENQRPVFIAWPATFDFMFVYWYIIKFTKQCEEEFLKYTPFAIAGLDIRTYAMSILKQNYLDTNSLPKKWTENTGEHTHRAIDDAKQNALIFINMLKENSK
jgi:DNA polymerase III alpha subunit (gram-positive type)